MRPRCLLVSFPTIPNLSRCASDLFTVAGVSSVILTSAGLSALAHLNRIAQEQHGALRVTGCSTDVMQVIEMVRFDKILALYRDISSATA